MTEIQKIGMFSLAKYFGIYLAILGVVLSIILIVIPTRYSTPEFILFLPGILALIGMLSGFIDAVIYNGLSVGLGGIKLDYSNGVIKKIDPLSVAKIYGLLNGVWGAVGSNVLGFILYFIAGFVAAYVMAWIYNLVSGSIGGIKINIQDNKLVGVEWVSVSKIATIFIVVGAFLVEIAIGILLLFLPQIGAISNPTLITATLIVLIASGIAVLFFALVFGFIFTAFEASFYNILSRNIDGIEVYFSNS